MRCAPSYEFMLTIMYTGTRSKEVIEHIIYTNMNVCYENTSYIYYNTKNK